MAIASGARTRMVYVAEVTRGTTPASPSMKILRGTSRNINLQKRTYRSEEIRDDRQIADERHGFHSVAGTLGFELAVGAYDDMLEGAMGGTWTTGASVSGINLGADSAASQFSRASGSFITDGFKKGDLVKTTGFANGTNNSTFRATAVAALLVTVDATLITEAAAASRTIVVQGKKLVVGTTLKTFTLERQFLDLAKYQVFKGCAINSLSLPIRPEPAMVQASLGYIGMSSAVMTGTPLDASPDAAATNSPLSSFDGRIHAGGTQIAVVTSLDINLDNGRVLEPVVGSDTSPDVFEGTAEISGTLTAFFENQTQIDQFYNENTSSLWVRLDDLNGVDFLNIVMPKITYTGADMDPPREGPFGINMPFTALVDQADSLTSMMIQRSNT